MDLPDGFLGGLTWSEDVQTTLRTLRA